MDDWDLADQMRSRSEQIANEGHHHSPAEQIGGFMFGFWLGASTADAAQERATARPSLGERLVRAGYVGLWAYLIFFLGGAILLMILSAVLT